MAKTNEVPTAADEKLVEVRLLRAYVPLNPQSDEDRNARAEGVTLKVSVGEVVALPRSEAKRVLDLGIAEITADLI